MIFFTNIKNGCREILNHFNEKTNKYIFYLLYQSFIIIRAKKGLIL